MMMFIKPVLGRVEGTQSGGAVYRKLVLRNIFCTTAIVISYSITTVAVVLAVLRESTDNNKVRGPDWIFLNPFARQSMCDQILP